MRGGHQRDLFLWGEISRSDGGLFTRFWRAATPPSPYCRSGEARAVFIRYLLVIFLSCPLVSQVRPIRATEEGRGGHSGQVLGLCWEFEFAAQYSKLTGVL